MNSAVAQDDDVVETAQIPTPPTKPTQSLQRSLEWTYQNNPTLQAARAQLRAIQEQLPQAYAGWKPTVLGEASITNTDIDGSNFGGATGSTAKDVVLSLNQPIYRGGTTFANVKGARAVIQAQLASLSKVEQDVLLDAATAYMNVLRDQALLDLSQNNYDVIDKQREATQDRFDVGELTKTDVSQAEARLAGAQSDIINARGNLKTSKAIFQQIIGFMPGALEKPNIELVDPLDLETAIIQGEETSPDVLTSFYLHQASENDIDSVFGELLPEVSFSSSWNRTRDPAPGLIDEQTTKAIGITATIPLYQAGSVRSRVREAKYTSNQRLLQITETKREVRQRIISAWEDLQAARAEIDSRKAQVDAAAIAREGVHSEAELGSRTILDALDADQELLDAKVALVTAQRNKTVAEFGLLAVLGFLTPEKLQFETPTFKAESKRQAFSFDDFDLDVDRIGDQL